MYRSLFAGSSGKNRLDVPKASDPSCRIMYLLDLDVLGTPAPIEEFSPCDLAERMTVERLVENCGPIVHLGSGSHEDAWRVNRIANIDGMVFAPLCLAAPCQSGWPTG